MSANGIDAAAAVREVIYKACLYKDDLQWDKWLELCDDDFEYAITAFSPEIQYDMTYLDGNRAEMATMVEMLPKHNTDHSPLKRHCVVYSVDVDEASQTAQAVSSVLIYQTLLDGINSHVDAGETRLFVAARYLDKFRIKDGAVKFTGQQVKLETRRLDKGSHWPL